MTIPEEPSSGTPEWMVTFGDLMTLLLTLFVMLVAATAIRPGGERDQSRPIAAAMRRQFGAEQAKAAAPLALESPARRAWRQRLLNARSARARELRGAPRTSVAVVKPAAVASPAPTLVATAEFQAGTPELTPAANRALVELARGLAGKPHPIELRGLTSRAASSRPGNSPDRWDLAYARCRSALQVFAAQGIPPDRIRLGVLPASERAPRDVPGDGAVEVLLLAAPPDQEAASLERRYR